MKCDFLVIGAGLFGAVFAHEAAKAGKKVLVIERRDHIGGNCYSYDDHQTRINLHRYGPHIFHTSRKDVWDYIRAFAAFNDYQHRVRAMAKGKLYSFPVNLETINQFYGARFTSEQAAEFLKTRIPADLRAPKNLEEKAISLVGPELYETFIRGYTRKQWGCDPRELPADVITRLPVRLSFNDAYYDNVYQGMPVGGYTPIFEKWLENIPVELEEDFFKRRDYWSSRAQTLVYTGAVDEYYAYRFGELNWRSCRFEWERLTVDDYQGVSIANYVDEEIPYTRVVEAKHFYPETKQSLSGTVITREFPCDGRREPYYPVRRKEDMEKFKKYRKLQERESRVIFGGRLAEYRYYNMDQVIASALAQARKVLA